MSTQEHVESGSKVGAGHQAEVIAMRPLHEGVFDSGAPEIASPIRKQVAGLGEVALIEDGMLIDSGRVVTQRPDRYFRIQYDGFGDGVRETQPELGKESGLTIVHFPGFIEKIESGSAKDFHTSLATQRPDARVISIASDGIGETGDNLDKTTFMDHGVVEMGERRAGLLPALVADGPTILSACSMGTVIKHHMLMRDAANGHNLNVRSVDYAAAIVSPERAAVIMAVLFPLAMAADTPREIFRMYRKYGIRHLVEQAEILQERSTDALPLIRQATSLLTGVVTKDMDKVLHEYRGSVLISGQLDPLRQLRMYLAIKKNNPSVHIKTVPRKGHSIAADGIGGGSSVVASINRYQIADELLSA